MNSIQKAAVNNKAIAETKAPITMQGYIKSMELEIARALPSVITPRCV